MRVSGNAFRLATNHWKEFSEHERELDQALAGEKMIVPCTLSLQTSRIADMHEMPRAHQFTIVRRKGNWFTNLLIQSPQ